MSAGDWKEMYQAAINGDLQLLEYHIKNGVNPNYQHPEILSTPLVTSIVQGHTDIAKFLIENGADPNLISYFDDMNAFEAAKKHNRKEILEMLNVSFNEDKKGIVGQLTSYIKNVFKAR